MKENILDEFFNLRQDDFVEEIEEDRVCLNRALKRVNVKEFQNSMKELPEEYEEIKNKIYDYVDTLTANYEIKRAYYDKKYYKQGFYDAVMINYCCKENK